MRDLKDQRTRAEKLRDLANHPTATEGERANARAELGRIKAPLVAPARVSWLDVGRSSNMEDFARNYAAAMRADAAESQHKCRVCGQVLVPDWVAFIGAPICPRHAPRKADAQPARVAPGSAGYYEWARGRQVGERVRVAGHNARFESVLESVETIARVTATQYIMADGARYRRTGRFPGYRVGEDGRSGRTYIAPVVA